MLNYERLQHENGRVAAGNDIKNLGIDYAIDHYESLEASGYSRHYIEGYLEVIDENV